MTWQRSTATFRAGLGIRQFLSLLMSTSHSHRRIKTGAIEPGARKNRSLSRVLDFLSPEAVSRAFAIHDITTEDFVEAVWSILASEELPPKERLRAAQLLRDITTGILRDRGILVQLEYDEVHTEEDAQSKFDREVVTVIDHVRSLTHENGADIDQYIRTPREDRDREALVPRDWEGSPDPQEEEEVPERSG